MGWFGSICRSVGRAVGSGIQKVGEFIGSETVERIGSNIEFACQESNTLGKNTGEMDEYDKEKARLSETKRMNEILSTYSIRLENKADDLEKNCIRESKVFFDYLIDKLEKENEKNAIKINANRLKKAFKDIEKQIKGSVKKHLAKRVSLDDTECLEILKMPSGEDKKRKMEQFGNKVFKESLDKLSKNIKTIINHQQDYLEEVLGDKVEEVVNITKKQLLEFEQIETLRNENEKEFETKKANIHLTLDICDFAIDKLEKIS